MGTNPSSSLKRSPLLWLLLLISLILVLIYKFCPEKKIGPLVVNNGPIVAPHAVSFLDVNGGASNVQKVKVTLIDSAGMVVSSNGVKLSSLEVNGGVMSIGLDPKANFSAKNPYRFFIRAEAVGYMPNIRPVVVTENVPNYIPIYLLNLEGPPPSGVASASNSIAAVSNGMVQGEQQIMTNRFVQGEVPPLTIRMLEGTQMLCDGKPVEAKGPLEYRLMFGIPRDSNANRVFPGGFEVTDAVDEKGNRLAWPAEPSFFTTAGWFSMEMNIGTAGVNGFSKPLEVTMPIRKGTVNPADQKPVDIGSVIPLWSVDERTGVWKKEGQISVEQGSDGLVGRFSVSHLSTYNIDYKGVQCTNTITINNSGAAITGQRITRFVDRATGDEIKTKLYDFDATSFPLTIIRFPASGNQHQLLIHRGIDPYDGIDLLGSSDVGCGALTGSISGIGGGGMQIQFTQVGAATAPVFCNNAFWYKNNTPMAVYSLGGIINSSGQINHSISGVKDVALWFYDPVAPPTEAVLTLDDLDFNTAGTSSSHDMVAYSYRVGAATMTGTLEYWIDAGRMYIQIPTAVATGTCTVID